jgi:hypothetical protein
MVVPLLQFQLLVEFSRALGGLAPQRHQRPLQMVLHCPIRVLATANHRSQYRGAEERLPSNAYTSHCHMYPHLW